MKLNYQTSQPRFNCNYQVACRFIVLIENSFLLLSSEHSPKGYVPRYSLFIVSLADLLASILLWFTGELTGLSVWMWVSAVGKWSLDIRVLVAFLGSNFCVSCLKGCFAEKPVFCSLRCFCEQKCLLRN